MKTQAILLIAAAALANVAGAANVANVASPASRTDASAYGQAVPPDSASRIVSLTPQTRFVNVTNGETVTFEKDGQRFTWHVDTYSNVSAFALAAIAPHALHADQVEIYVASDEYYQH
ncbi:CzcE family metal-binding protein [uncultured Massilia sp.]|uniref:CzcE family metal-binding protein n=1 Tax=uncultured Massilia sp. TaxID=169973 RepID=UPI0025DC202E|nr:CzcE family metal-binding protein [uncultured Massilia sp.]